jgi:hypothetical protein
MTTFTKQELTEMEKWLEREKPKDVPENLWQRYDIYVSCVWGHESVKSFSEWLGD